MLICGFERFFTPLRFVQNDRSRFIRYGQPGMAAVRLFGDFEPRQVHLWDRFLRMTSINFADARDYIVDKLSSLLPSDLYYHGVNHTVKDVIRAVKAHAEEAGIEGEALMLLETAAYYHDCGYLKQYYFNEPIAVEIAADVLPGFGYSKGQVEVIGRIIMATQLPQKPDGLLEEIMCDADLDSLGRDDFFITSHCLRLELAAYGQPTDVYEWYEKQLAFLESHSYFTDIARAARDAGKKRNIEEIKKLLGRP